MYIYDFSDSGAIGVLAILVGMIAAYLSIKNAIVERAWRQGVMHGRWWLRDMPIDQPHQNKDDERP